MERRAAVMAKLLVAMVKAKRLRALVADHVRHGCTSAAVDHEQESSAIVSLLVTLPSRVANALRAAPPSVLSHDSFYRILTSDMLHALVSEASSAQGHLARPFRIAITAAEPIATCTGICGRYARPHCPFRPLP